MGPATCRVFPALLGVLLAGPLLPRLQAHDIPNQRVDRSTQVTLRPGRLELDYEVSLTELTLTQDLRRLIGSLPGADRTAWLERYGQETGPLNARGFLITRDGLPVELRVRGFDLAVEEHPRYTFHLEADLPASGRLTVHDTNYVSSEGTSRLAVRGQDGVTLTGDDLPSEVAEIPIRPLWMLGDEEERRTRQVEVEYRLPAVERPPSASVSAVIEPTNRPMPPTTPGLSQLMDRRTGASWLGLLLAAAALGAAHSVQPGHGKTLVSAVALGPGARWYQPVLLGVITTLTHTGSVLVIAAALWFTGATRVAGLHQVLSRLAGFAIAAGGFWRIGRAVSGLPAERTAQGPSPSATSLSGLVGLGLAGGLVPCWDAVSLVILSAALDRLPTGVLLVLAFGLGMGTVLLAVGLTASHVRSALSPRRYSHGLETWLSLLSGVLLAVIGLAFFLR